VMDGENTPMRLRGKMVRFYLPDVLQELREKAKTSKRGCTRKLQPPEGKEERRDGKKIRQWQKDGGRKMKTLTGVN